MKLFTKSSVKSIILQVSSHSEMETNFCRNWTFQCATATSTQRRDLLLLLRYLVLCSLFRHWYWAFCAFFDLEWTTQKTESTGEIVTQQLSLGCPRVKKFWAVDTLVESFLHCTCRLDVVSPRGRVFNTSEAIFRLASWIIVVLEM